MAPRGGGVLWGRPLWETVVSGEERGVEKGMGMGLDGVMAKAMERGWDWVKEPG